MLTLDIEWLAGVCYAARDPSDPTPDWPPQPDRIFSALVASWSARGCDVAERAALEWLEAQAPPVLSPCGGAARTSVTSYVPVNDKHDFTQVGGRSRQARQFPSLRLDDEADTHLRLVWCDAEPGAHLQALRRLACDTSYVGHSASMVRCQFSASEDDGDLHAAIAAMRAPYQGRLTELEALFDRHMKGDERARPRPSQRSGVNLTESRAAETPFGQDWIVLEHAGGERPDLRAIAPVAKAMRDALMSVWGDPIPEWLSGHRADGAPSALAHLAVTPLANVGFTWSDGALMGLALVAPRERETAWRDPAPAAWDEQQRFHIAIDRLHKVDPTDGDQHSIMLKLGAAGVWRLRRAGGMLHQSLRCERYCAAAHIWTSATPITLDRHLKSEGAERLSEAAEAIKRSCANMGLPSVRVRVHKHAAVIGSPPAWPPGGAPHWQNWARPASLKARPLFHAALEFEAPVQGPLLLGAGRFFGLGLCLPFGPSQ